MNINELRKIIDEAPDGATHYDFCGYYKFSASGWEFYNLGINWIKTKIPPVEIRLLSDIKTIIELYDSLNTVIEEPNLTQRFFDCGYHKPIDELLERFQ